MAVYHRILEIAFEGAEPRTSTLIVLGHLGYEHGLELGKGGREHDIHLTTPNLSRP